MALSLVVVSAWFKWFFKGYNVADISLLSACTICLFQYKRNQFIIQATDIQSLIIVPFFSKKRLLSIFSQCRQVYGSYWLGDTFKETLNFWKPINRDLMMKSEQDISVVNLMMLETIDP